MPALRRGCHNDVVMMKRFVESQGFDPNNSKILMDDGHHEEPTSKNIMQVNTAPNPAPIQHKTHGKYAAQSTARDAALIPDDGERAGVSLAS